MSLLTDHLDEVGESYFKHMAKAMGFAVKMLSVAAICLVHAVAPFLFVRTGSDRVRRLADIMDKRQQQVGDQTTEQHPSPPLEQHSNGVETTP